MAGFHNTHPLYLTTYLDPDQHLRALYEVLIAGQESWSTGIWISGISFVLSALVRSHKGYCWFVDRRSWSNTCQLGACHLCGVPSIRLIRGDPIARWFAGENIDMDASSHCRSNAENGPRRLQLIHTWCKFFHYVIAALLENCLNNSVCPRVPVKRTKNLWQVASYIGTVKAQGGERCTPHDWWLCGSLTSSKMKNTAFFFVQVKNYGLYQGQRTGRYWWCRRKCRKADEQENCLLITALWPSSIGYHWKNGESGGV